MSLLIQAVQLIVAQVSGEEMPDIPTMVPLDSLGLTPQPDVRLERNARQTKLLTRKAPQAMLEPSEPLLAQ